MYWQQVDVWQVEERIGVVCYDRQRADIYLARHPDAELQLSQIRNFRFVSAVERATSMLVFLTSSLVYSEYIDKVPLDIIALMRF